jgi:methanogenic corrinoid protein MtbC1
MSLEEINEQVSNLSRIPEDSDAKIESLLLAMIDLDEMRFQNTLYHAIEKMGFECAFIKVVAPFMAKAGVLWMSGTINPAQEHFVSNLIRQKLIAEIDRMGPAPLGKANRFLLFLPEGELHELGLLFMTYLVRKNGHEVLYFGQSTPLGSAVEAAESWKPDVIGLSLVNGLAFAELEDFLYELKQAFPDLPILLQGYQTQFIDPENFPGFHIVNDFEAFTSWLANL